MDSKFAEKLAIDNCFAIKAGNFPHGDREDIYKFTLDNIEGLISDVYLMVARELKRELYKGDNNPEDQEVLRCVEFIENL